MRSLVILALTLSFGLVGCSSKEKKKEKPKKTYVEGQLPDHDYKIHQPLETEIMVMIDSRGKAKQIPNEWDVDTSGHMAYSTSKPVAAKRKLASKKKKKKRKKSKKRKKRKKRKKKR